jgi:hypothetical protein
MKIYNGLPREKVFEVYNFVMMKRNELKYGQRKLHNLVVKEFGFEILESTIAGWIFKKIKPFRNEKTQFKAKPKPLKEELYKEYIEQSRSAEKIAREYKVSTVIVINWLKSYGIATRNHLESMNTPSVKEELKEKRLRRPTKEYDSLSPEKAYILGVLCGDGFINEEFISFEIRFDEDFIKEFASCFKKVYGLTYNYRYYKPKNTYILRIGSQIICRDLNRYGKFRTENWNVPKEILKSEDDVVIGAFLRGFYDSEGCAARSAITSSSINERGIKEIAFLLKKLGLDTTLRPQQGGRYFVLSIFRKERFKIFKEKVGFSIARKQSRIEEVLANNIYHKNSYIPKNDKIY